jgi:hypothetical protein
MHALRRAQGDHGSLRAPHAVLLGCTIWVMDEFRSPTFGLKLNFGKHPWDRTSVYSILSQNGC